MLLKIFVLVFFSGLILGPPISYSEEPIPVWLIVNGDEAGDGQFPYIVSVQWDVIGHICGGSILNENWILTAAHCFKRITTDSLEVVAGINRLDQEGDRYSVSEIVTHPEWDGTLINDVALVKLASPIAFNEKVQPIELKTEEVGADEDAVVCGWGTTNEEDALSNSLQFISIKTMDLQECKNAGLNFPVYDFNICTPALGKGACHGDSGGPLASNGKQIGIVSWGRPCGTGLPDVYSRISTFAPWIKSIVGV